MMQSNNTKSENLENDSTEILEKTHLLGWNSDHLLGRLFSGAGRVADLIGLTAHVLAAPRVSSMTLKCLAENGSQFFNSAEK